MWVDEDNVGYLFKKEANSNRWEEIRPLHPSYYLTEISFDVDSDDELFVILYSIQRNATVRLASKLAIIWQTNVSFPSQILSHGYWSRNFSKLI